MKLFITPALTLLVACVATRGTAGAAEKGGEPGFVMEARLTEAELQRRLSGDDFGLPQLQVYDSTGRLLRDFGKGFQPITFEAELSALVQNPVAPVEAAVTLPALLAVLVSRDGAPVRDLSPVKLTFAECWASWCAPCHMQFDALVTFLSAHPDVEVRLIHVETDPALLGDEVKLVH